MRLPFWIAAVVLSVGVSVPTSDAHAEMPRGRVLIIGSDGTRPDALAQAKTPNLDKLIREGAFTDKGDILGERYTKNNTISGPSWSSILTGVWADKHGVHDNTFKGRNFELFPHFFKRIKAVYPDAQTVSLVSWGPIHEFILTDADIEKVERFPRSKGGLIDLNVPADKFKINTRDGEWHHLLATRDENGVQLYLDGKLVDTLESELTPFDLAGEFYFLGRDSRKGRTRFKGDLDDIRIWQRALTPEEISASAQAKPVSNREGLLAEYTFTSESNSADSAEETLAALRNSASQQQNSLHASLSPSKQKGKSDEDTLSVANGVLSLPENGADDQGLQVELTPELRGVTQGKFTVEARFKTTDSGRNILCGNFGNGAGNLNIELHEGNSVRLYLSPTKIAKQNNLEREDQRDKAMAENAARILREEDPMAMFVYFHQSDATGHTIGFSPEIPEYIRSIENVDTYVGTVLEGLYSRKNFKDENWLVIVCTDHGGHLKTHSNGHDNPEIREVFLIVNGQDAKVGRIEEQAYLVDVAGTALAHLLGKVDPRWQIDGKAVGLESR